MFRILMVAHAFPPTVGGVETHLWDLSHELSSRVHIVHCLVGGERSAECFGQVTVARHPELTARHLIEQHGTPQDSEINGGLLTALSDIAATTVEKFRPGLVHMHNAHHFAPELALAFFQEHASALMLNGVHDRIGDK